MVAAGRASPAAGMPASVGLTGETFRLVDACVEAALQRATSEPLPIASGGRRPPPWQAAAWAETLGLGTTIADALLLQLRTRLDGTERLEAHYLEELRRQGGKRLVRSLLAEADVSERLSERLWRALEALPHAPEGHAHPPDARRSPDGRREAVHVDERAAASAAPHESAQFFDAVQRPQGGAPLPPRGGESPFATADDSVRSPAGVEIGPQFAGVGAAPLPPSRPMGSAGPVELQQSYQVGCAQPPSADPQRHARGAQRNLEHSFPPQQP